MLVFDLISLYAHSYQERLRDWPNDAQQPAVV